MIHTTIKELQIIDDMISELQIASKTEVYEWFNKLPPEYKVKFAWVYPVFIGDKPQDGVHGFFN